MFYRLKVANQLRKAKSQIPVSQLVRTNYANWTVSYALVPQIAYSHDSVLSRCEGSGMSPQMAAYQVLAFERNVVKNIDAIPRVPDFWSDPTLQMHIILMVTGTATLLAMGLGIPEEAHLKNFPEAKTILDSFAEDGFEL